MDSQTPQHYTRNMIGLVTDYVAFTIAVSFVDQSTVVPSFVSHLTTSAPLIGLVSTLQSGGWLLPQLFAANYVGHRPRKKPYIIWPSLVGRPMMLVLALAALFLAEKMPTATLLVFYLGYALLWVCDGLASVPWFDVLAKVFPGRRRGRYLAMSQVLGGLLAVGAGALVQRVLDPQAGVAFPKSYALLFGLAGAFFTVSILGVGLIVEPVESVQAQRSSWRQYTAQLARSLRADRRFALAIVLRLLAGFGGMGTPFFILYGTGQLGLGAGIVGSCLTAQVIGRIVGGLLLGVWLAKLGHRSVILGAISLTAMAPALALLLGGPSWFGQETLRLLYPAIFFFIGISANTLMWSFTNYVLDIAPPEERPTYVGLTNTIGGLLIVAPVLGGALLQATSYPVLFAAALSVYIVTLLLALRLPPVRSSSTAGP